MATISTILDSLKFSTGQVKMSSGTDTHTLCQTQGAICSIATKLEDVQLTIFPKGGYLKLEEHNDKNVIVKSYDMFGKTHISHGTAKIVNMNSDYIMLVNSKNDNLLLSSKLMTNTLDEFPGISSANLTDDYMNTSLQNFPTEPLITGEFLRTHFPITQVFKVDYDSHTCTTDPSGRCTISTIYKNEINACPNNIYATDIYFQFVKNEFSDIPFISRDQDVYRKNKIIKHQCLESNPKALFHNDSEHEKPDFISLMPFTKFDLMEYKSDGTSNLVKYGQFINLNENVGLFEGQDMTGNTVGYLVFFKPVTLEHQSSCASMIMPCSGSTSILPGIFSCINSGGFFMGNNNPLNGLTNAKVKQATYKTVANQVQSEKLGLKENTKYGHKVHISSSSIERAVNCDGYNFSSDHYADVRIEKNDFENPDFDKFSAMLDAYSFGIDYYS